MSRGRVTVGSVSRTWGVGQESDVQRGGAWTINVLVNAWLVERCSWSVGLVIAVRCTAGGRVGGGHVARLSGLLGVVIGEARRGVSTTGIISAHIVHQSSFGRS